MLYAYIAIAAMIYVWRAFLRLRKGAMEKWIWVSAASEVNGHWCDGCSRWRPKIERSYPLWAGDAFVFSILLAAAWPLTAFVFGLCKLAVRSGNKQLEREKAQAIAKAELVDAMKELE